MFQTHLILTLLVLKPFLGLCQVSCGYGEVKCANSDVCYPSVNRCDHVVDCPDNSDESLCSGYPGPPCQRNFTKIGQICYSIDGVMNRFDAAKAHCNRKNAILPEVYTEYRGKLLNRWIRNFLNVSAWTGLRYDTWDQPGPVTWEDSRIKIQIGIPWITGKTHHCARYEKKQGYQLVRYSCYDRDVHILCQAKTISGAWEFKYNSSEKPVMVNSQDFQALRISGIVHIAYATNETIISYNKIEFWAGYGRTNKKFICSALIAVGSTSAPCVVNKITLTGKNGSRVRHVHFNISSTFTPSHGEQEFFGLINPNNNPEIPSQRNFMTKIWSDKYGPLPIIYSALADADGQTAALTNGDRLGFFGFSITSMKLCVEIGGIGIFIRFESILDNKEVATNKYQARVVARVCHEHDPPDVFPVAGVIRFGLSKLRVKHVISSFVFGMDFVQTSREWTFWRVFNHVMIGLQVLLIIKLLFSIRRLNRLTYDVRMRRWEEEEEWREEEEEEDAEGSDD